MIELTRREKMAIVVTTSISFMVGLWVGVWSVPVEALSVPTDAMPNGNGGTNLTPAYRPVPTWLPFTTVALPALCIFGAHQYLYKNDETQPTNGELGEEVTADD